MRQLAFIFLFFSLACCAQTGKTKVITLPKGVVKKGNTITITDNYTIVKDGKGAKIMKKKAGGGFETGIFGTFDCECMESPPGSCILNIAPNGLSCINNTCNGCVLNIQIPGFKGKTILKNIK